MHPAGIVTFGPGTGQVILLPPPPPPPLPLPPPPLEFMPDLNGMQFGTGATFDPGTGQIGLPTLLHTVEFVLKSKLQVIVPTLFSKYY